MMDPKGVTSFNPRTRESATVLAEEPENRVDVSIHALVRVRRVMEGMSRQKGGFQSTHS